MATSSIFTTPQFTTEDSVRTLINAIESSEKTRDRLIKRLDALDVKELSSKQEIDEFMKTVQ